MAWKSSIFSNTFLRCWTVQLIALVGIVIAANVAEWEILFDLLLASV